MRGARFALAAACLVALAGCRVDLGLDVTVDAEGAGSLALRVAPDGELVALATDAGVDPIAQLAAAVDELDGWTVEGPTGDPPVLVLTAGFDDPEELAELSAGLAEAFTAPEATLLEPLALTVTEEELALSGGAALVPGEALVEYGVEPAEAVARLGDTIGFIVTATFPGPVLTTDGVPVAQPSEVPTAVRWEVPAGTRIPLNATAQRPQTTVLLLAGGAAAGALVAALVVLVVRSTVKRRRTASQPPQLRRARRG